MEDNHLQHFKVYSEVLYSYSSLNDKPGCKYASNENSIKTLKLAITLQPKNAYIQAKCYRFMQNYKVKINREKQKKKKFKYMLKSLQISYQVFSINYYFTKQSLSNYQSYNLELPHEEYLLFPAIYELIKNQDYPVIMENLTLASHMATQQKTLNFLKSLLEIYKEFSEKKSVVDQTR